jgi:hypothetical protein
MDGMALSLYTVCSYGERKKWDRSPTEKVLTTRWDQSKSMCRCRSQLSVGDEIVSAMALPSRRTLMTV